MDNHEDYLDALTAYARNPGPEIPAVLERYLSGVAKNGETLFQWPLLKPLIVGKMEQVIQELAQGLEAENIPTRPNVENVRFEVMHARIMDAVHKFTGAPFTIQRLCELLLDPKCHYKRSDKFMRGLEKNVLVVSTVDPFGRKVVSESSNKHLVNGMDGSSSPLLPRDPHSSTPLPPVPDWVTSPAAHRNDTGSALDQTCGISTNGVAEGLVTSVYTDQGDQPIAVQTEEVVEETVVTMETNEVTDGGEALAEVDEEEMGAEDTNASSSSSSSSSSEELSVSDSSESSGPAAPSTSVSSSSEGQPADRPWACLTDPPAPPQPEWAQTNPQSSPSSDSDGATEDAPLAWHPVAEPGATVASSSSSPSQTPDPNDTYGFEVTTSAATTATECSMEAIESPDKTSVPIEDSGGASDEATQPVLSTPPSATEVVDFPGNGSLAPSEVITSSSSPASGQDSAILSPTAPLPLTPYPECDSVAGLERLVSSVDAASPIAVLSSSSSPLAAPSFPPSDEADPSCDSPEAKKMRLSPEEDVGEEGGEPPQQAISSTSSSTTQPATAEEESIQGATPSEPPSQPDNCVPSADTTFEKEVLEEELTAEVESDSMCQDSEVTVGEAEKKEESAPVSSPPSQLSSSSSESTGFEMSGEESSSEKAYNAVTASGESEQVEETGGSSEEAMQE